MRWLILSLLIISPSPVTAETSAEALARAPELFDAQTGYRIDRQRGPTPSDIPGPAVHIGTEEAKRLVEAGAVPLDVFGAPQSRFDELDGAWLVSEPRESLPGALWLPEVGRARLQDGLHEYLTGELAKATDGDARHPIVVFCVADCWMSWNAAQRIARMGYSSVYWYAHGTDGWKEMGYALAPVDPVPVPVD